MKADIDRDIIKRFETLGNLRIDEPLSRHTSFRTGGPADILITPYSVESLIDIIDLAGEKSLPLTVVGGCSNILAGDSGVRGLVVKLCEEQNIDGRIEVKDNLVYADAIVKKEGFINFCLEKGFSGMEFMAGIPGCIGGGIVMNAGIDASVFADILESIAFIDMKGTISTKRVTGEMATYRRLRVGENAIILGGYFLLDQAGDIEESRRKINGYIEDRKIKHPLDRPSAGSVFKNPPGHSSWRLIDEAGLKGKRVGGAAVSDLHTNFIINTGRATSADILNLIEFIRETVQAKFNVLLETEIRMIGDFQ